jgi:hypothetical protein
LQAALKPLLASIRVLSEQIKNCDRRIRVLAAEQYPETRLLQQVQGVGPLVALTYVLTLEDPHRFPKSRSVGSYLGLRPRQSESGNSTPQLGITKAGSGQLRRLLVQSSQYMLSSLAQYSRRPHPARDVVEPIALRVLSRLEAAVPVKFILHPGWIVSIMLPGLDKRLCRGMASWRRCTDAPHRNT